MYRQIIWEFLGQQRLKLRDTGFSHFTLCIIGRNTEASMIKLLVPEDQIIVYHVNEPRMYQKSYGFDTLSDTILAMLFEEQQTLHFAYQDFTYEIKDPFYLKDFRKQSFQDVYIIPITQDEQLIGAALFYFQQEVVDFSVSSRDLNALLVQLQKDEEMELHKTVEQAIIQQEAYLIALKSNQKNVYLCSDQLASALGISSVWIDTFSKETEKQALHCFLNHPNTKTLYKQDVTVYYLRQQIWAEPLSTNILIKECLREHSYSGALALLFCASKLIEDIPFWEFINHVYWKLGDYLHENQCKTYQVAENSAVILIDNRWSKRQLMTIKNLLSDYYTLYLQSPEDITDKMNLLVLADYIDEIRPSKFDINAYKSYRDHIHQEQFQLEGEYPLHQMVHSETLQVMGSVYLLPPKDYGWRVLYRNYTDTAYKVLQDIYENEASCAITTLLVDDIYTRKILELIKKIVLQGKKLYIILHSVMYSAKYTELAITQSITRLKQLGIGILVDSTIFTNIRFSYITYDADGVYLQKDEFIQIQNHPDSPIHALLYFLYQNQKWMVCETTEHLNKDKEYCNPFTYFIR